MDNIISIIYIILGLLLVVLPLYYVIHMGNPKGILPNLLYGLAVVGFIFCALSGFFAVLLSPMLIQAITDGLSYDTGSRLLLFVLCYIANYVLVAVGKKLDRKYNQQY